MNFARMTMDGSLETFHCFSVNNERFFGKKINTKAYGNKTCHSSDNRSK